MYDRDHVKRAESCMAIKYRFSYWNIITSKIRKSKSDYFLLVENIKYKQDPKPIILGAYWKKKFQTRLKKTKWWENKLCLHTENYES